MAYLIGAVLALAVVGLAAIVQLDRDGAFYPTVLVVVASYYVLFAVMGGSTRALMVESLIMTAFLVVAVVGFRQNLWLVAVALGAHGIMDSFHGRVVTNPGVPAWWPPFCMTFDIVAAGYLAWLLWRRHATLLTQQKPLIY